MLCIAPEPQLEERFRQVSKLDYLTLDLSNPRAEIHADITNAPFPEEIFDIIYCSHVLEHVLDDRKALFELVNLLKSDGWAIILVPLSSSVTYEDPLVTDPEDRKKVYGHPSHVRHYGPDFRDRLEAAGFSVRVFLATDVVDKKDIIRLGVKQETIFFCTKEKAPANER
jgi:SAM-dependent methyltransferase